MKTAIIFCFHHGTTAKVAKLITERLQEKQVILLDLGKDPKPRIDNLNRLIIEGSIHFRMIQKLIRSLFERNLKFLLQKEKGLFICCMGKEKQVVQFEKAFPEA